jgi:hypothetical protein
LTAIWSRIPAMNCGVTESRSSALRAYQRRTAASDALIAGCYNFRLLIRWLRLLLFRFLVAFFRPPSRRRCLKLAIFTDDSLGLQQDPTREMLNASVWPGNDDLEVVGIGYTIASHHKRPA